MDQKGFVWLAAEPRAAGVARDLVRDRLRAWQLDELVDTALLLTSEIVTNALLHARSGLGISVSRDGDVVTVAVADSSPALPRSPQHSATATTGRGVRMLQELAEGWGCDAEDTGKVVWFRLSAAVDPWAAVTADVPAAAAEATGASSG